MAILGYECRKCKATWKPDGRSNCGNCDWPTGNAIVIHVDLHGRKVDE